MSNRLGQAVVCAAASVLLLLWCFLCTAAAASTPAECSITVSGFAAGSAQQGIREASWHCSNSAGTPKPTAAVGRVLKPFQRDFTGISWDSRCQTSGCLITICGTSAVLLTDSRFLDINSTGGLHSVLCITNSSQVTLRDSLIYNNNLRGLYGAGQAVIKLENSSVSTNYGLPQNNGAGLYVTGNVQLSLVNSTVEANWANAANAGGVFAGGSATVTINSSRLLRNYCDAGDADCVGGAIVGTENATVVLAGKTVLPYNWADSSGGGIALSGRASLLVEDSVSFANNTVRSGRGGADVFAEGYSRLRLPTPVFEEQGSVDAGRISKCSRGVLLKTVTCGVGERPDSREEGVCLCCPERSFNFDMSGECRPCPDGASCPGGYAVQPLPGFFRSSLWSDQVHRCPLSTDSCAGNDMCTAAYTGNLCGSCAPGGYGHVSPLRCTKCMQPRVQLGVYLLLSFVTVLFVAITVHYTWKDNLEASSGLRPSDIIKVIVQFLQFLVIVGSVSGPRWPEFMKSLFRVSGAVFGAASGQALSLDCWLAHYQPFGNSLPRAMQLQLFTFLAPLLVFAAVCLLGLIWWGVQRLSSTAADTFADFGTHSGRCGSMWACGTRLKPTTCEQLMRKLPVTALIVAYYAYPSLLRASMSFFACLHIDKAPQNGSTPIGPDGSPVPLLSHVYGYSVLDIQQPCFAGYHRGWALGLGIPALVITALGVPAALLWLLTAKASSIDDPSMREHFGFLYRNYKPDKMWWEAVWAAQMVLLSVVDAFHFRLEAYNSMLLLCLIFVVGAALQSLLKPYNVPELYEVHFASSACLFLTCLAALAMFPVDKSAESMSIAHTVIAVLVVIMDVGFILYALYAVFSSRAVTVWCGKAASLCGSPSFVAQVTSMLSVSLGPADSASSQAHEKRQRKGSSSSARSSSRVPSEQLPAWRVSEQLPTSRDLRGRSDLPVERLPPTEDSVPGLLGRLLASSRGAGWGSPRRAAQDSGLSGGLAAAGGSAVPSPGQPHV